MHANKDWKQDNIGKPYLVEKEVKARNTGPGLSTIIVGVFVAMALHDIATIVLGLGVIGSLIR